jgi:hypothetical protein
MGKRLRIVRVCPVLERRCRRTWRTRVARCHRSRVDCSRNMRRDWFRTRCGRSLLDAASDTCRGRPASNFAAMCQADARARRPRGAAKPGRSQPARLRACRRVALAMFYAGRAVLGSPRGACDRACTSDSTRSHRARAWRRSARRAQPADRPERCVTSPGLARVGNAIKSMARPPTRWPRPELSLEKNVRAA